MNRSSSSGVKLTTVVFAVVVLAVTALLSSGSAADDKEVEIEQASIKRTNELIN